MKMLTLALMALIISGCGSVLPTPSLNLSPDINISPGASGKTSVDEPEEPSAGRGNAYAAQMAQPMFSYMFSPGGMWLWQKDFKEGQWASWLLTSDSQEQIDVEIALLKNAEESRKWWRLGYEDSGTKIIYEALVLMDTFSLRRLRAKTNGEEPFEVPVAENTLGTYGSPSRITPESLQAAIVETQNITVPAGTFSAQRAEFGVTSGGQLEIWLNEEVPGGVVKYRLTEDGDEIFHSELKDYGEGAETILNSY
ncbi:MAG: hypothetical protein ACQESB_04055 [Elusimicrobiota bacterium]